MMRSSTHPKNARGIPAKKMAAEKKLFFMRVFTTKKVNIFLNQFLSDFQESQICLDWQVASSHGGVLGPLVDR